jgi:hypothetical protein
MSRPTLGNSKTERLNMLITADEIEVIDDWRFANRIGTRSEAVRQLVKIGLNAASWRVRPASAFEDEQSLPSLICFGSGGIVA